MVLNSIEEFKTTSPNIIRKHTTLQTPDNRYH